MPETNTDSSFFGREFRPLVLTLAVSLFLVVFANISLWERVFTAFEQNTLSHAGFLFAVFLMLVVVFNLLLSVLAFRHVLKPVLITLLLLSSFAAYFMDNFGAMLDPGMMRNVFATNPAEVLDLLTVKLFVYFLLIGLLPSLLVYKVRVRYGSLTRQLGGQLAVVAVSVAVLAGTILPFSKEYASLVRNNREVRYLMNPISYISATSKVIRIELRQTNRSIQQVGVDAVMHMPITARGKPNLVILVVGETARAQNFAFNGYQRNTNPMLAGQNIINFSNVMSCGTNTGESVPCMFSHLPRTDFDSTEANYYENLLDIVSRAGVRVIWRENNAGCKGVCARVETEDFTRAPIEAFCEGNECLDEVLLHQLQAQVDRNDGDILVVMHQMGSHGPAYYKRFTGQFRQFMPICETNQLQDCSQEQIRNVYDDTLLYTDYVLSKTVDFLKQNSARYDTAMLYISDHGESLGENNLYLHSTPYLIAPDEQKHVPFFMWVSPGFERDAPLSSACLRDRAAESYSHDNLFHSMLGLLGVKTGIYDRQLDIFSACRQDKTNLAALRQARGIH